MGTVYANFLVRVRVDVNIFMHGQTPTLSLLVQYTEQNVHSYLKDLL